MSHLHTIIDNLIEYDPSGDALAPVFLAGIPAVDAILQDRGVTFDPDSFCSSDLTGRWVQCGNSVLLCYQASSVLLNTSMCLYNPTAAGGSWLVEVPTDHPDYRVLPYPQVQDLDGIPITATEGESTNASAMEWPWYEFQDRENGDLLTYVLPCGEVPTEGEARVLVFGEKKPRTVDVGELTPCTEYAPLRVPAV